MGRAILFAAGIYLTTCGISLLPVEKISLNWNASAVHGSADSALESTATRVVTPPRWLSFSLMTVGSVAALYAVALPARRRYQEA
ncbi:MAG: hypothetical protein U0903_14075 [Planctomycetales bacterium]